MSRFILIFLAACGSGTLDVDADEDRYRAGEDCDDDDASSHPGGTEVCDGADNDCDGVVDNGGGTPFYGDVDSDGYGDPNAITTGCGTPPAGSVSNADDCDDADPAIRPGGVEVCDGKDNDCDGEPDWGLRVPADFAAIGAAIGAASDGEHICVSAGRYIENIDFAGRRIHVEGLAGAAATVLDGGGVGPVVSFDTKEGPDTILSGFTITGGDEPDGAGIFLRGASPTLRDLIITDNVCTAADAACRGTGIYAENSAFTLTDSIISENVQRSTNPYYPTDQGAGVWLDARSKPTLRRVRIEDNRAEADEDGYYGLISGVGLYVTRGAPVLDEVQITGNQAEGPAYGTYIYGAGVYTNAAGGSFDRVTIADNVGEGYAVYGGGVYYYDYGDLEIRNTAILNNVAGDKGTAVAYGGGLYSSYGRVELENVDIVGNEALGLDAAGGGMLLTYYGTLDQVNTGLSANRVTGSVTSRGAAIAVDPTYPIGTIAMSYSNFTDHGASLFNLADPVGANGNVSVDPGYTSTSGDGATWNLTLAEGSKLIDAGDPEIEDANGSRSDIGSKGGPNGAW